MQHERMLRQNLYDINLYARKSLDALERGVDVVPDWVHHKIATARTHMKDAGHFVRYEQHEGRRYSGDKNEMCKGALMNISEYAGLISESLEKGQKPIPEWVQNKLAVAAELMDCVGHYLEHRAEGRVYSGEKPFAYIVQAHDSPAAGSSRKSARRRSGRGFRGSAAQTQQFQKQYRGPRIYGETVEKVYESRGVAAVGGVQWVSPPARPGAPYRGQPQQEYQPVDAGPVALSNDPPRPGYILAAHPRHLPSSPCPHCGENHPEDYGESRERADFVDWDDSRRRRYSHTEGDPCPLCGEHHENEYDERLYGAGEGCEKVCEVINPFTQKCSKWGCKKSSTDMEIKNPFKGVPSRRPVSRISTAPVGPKGRTPSGRRRHVRPEGVHRGAPMAPRRFGVPGFAPGEPGWAGAGGIAQAPGPGCGRGRRGSAPPHGYGSLGSERSMGDGSMDLATGGERMDRDRRYGMTWRYDNICSQCGGEAEGVDERRYAASPDLKPIFRCIKVINPFTGEVKEVCSGGRTITSKPPTGPDIKDPFGMKRGPQFSAGGSSDSTRGTRRRRRRKAPKSRKGRMGRRR